MRSHPGPRAALRITFVVLSVALSGCATDEIDLAPVDPDHTWPIPSSQSNANVVDGNQAGSTKTTGPVSNYPTAPANQAASGDGADISRGNAVVIDPKRQYDLAGLIDLAQRKNPLTRAAWERARQAALAVGLSETAYVPQISAEIVSGFQHTPFPIPSDLVSKGYFTTNTRELIPTLTARWLLFDFGQREAAVDATKANSFVANVGFTDAHQQLVYAVSRDYFALNAARGRLRVADQALADAEVVEDAANLRRSHGLATVVDVAQAKRQTAQAHFNLERARGAEHASYAALIDSMGIAPTTTIGIAENSADHLPDLPASSLDDLIQEAMRDRPEVVMALGRIKAAQADLSGARAAYYPTLSLEAQAYQNLGGVSTMGSQYYSVNEPGANILLKLSLPLYDGGTRDAKTAIARSEISEANAALDQARDSAVKEVVDAFDALRTSFAEHSAALKIVDAAQTAYEAALDSYRHGVGTYTDLVNDETALSQAQSEKEDAHANVFTAAAALAFSTGAILNQP
jgi:outer membrane protein TolC